MSDEFLDCEGFINKTERKNLLFVCRLFDLGGIRASLMSLINSVYKKYDISIVVLSERISDDDIRYFRNRYVKMINAGLILNLIYTPGEYYKEKKKSLKLALKALTKINCKLFTEKCFVRMSMKKISKQLSDKNFDVVISFTNDIWVDGWCMPGCNYLVSTIKTYQRIGWIHAAVDYLGLTHDNLKETYHNYDKVICVSDACKSELLDTCPELNGKVYTCHNMVDKDRLDFLKNQSIENRYIRNGVFRIITVARIELRSKRQDRIVNIAGMLKKKGISFVWYLVGGGMDYDKVHMMVEKAGLADKIIMTGMKDNPYSLMTYSDLFVLTSDTESFGIVLKESIMCGTPVITTDFPAAGEVVENKVNGYIVPMDNRAIFDKICSVIDNRKDLERLSKNCMNYVDIGMTEFEDMIGG